MSVVGGISEVKEVENVKVLVELLEFINLVDAATPVPVGISEAKGVEYSAWIDKVSRIVVNIVNMFQNTHLEFWKVLDYTIEDLMYTIKLEVSNGGRMMIYKTKVVISTLETAGPVTSA